MNASMQPADLNETIWRDLLHAARHDDGAAARENLEAGVPIYYVEDDTPEGLLIKEYPDGHRELIRVAGDREEVVRTL
ncbi:MAG: hypothetical protein LBE59_07830 [Nevskiaceae bacterium]|jgi:hypothetical protein|nr:hypothetical protein [Nevskiaceae bacterium]